MIILASLIVFYFVFRLLDLSYALYYRKPIYLYQRCFVKTLPSTQKALLGKFSNFYQSLSGKHQKYFEHRVFTFLRRTKFVAKEMPEVTEEMKIRIASVAVMLTFGFRDCRLKLLEYIIVTPTIYFSPLAQGQLKGEFMPKRKTLVLSWSDFVKGDINKKDAIHLGIHEFTHVLQLNSEKHSNLSAIIFTDTYKGLIKHMASDTLLRDRIISTEFFRSYAYTDSSEFLAVLLETFIERPESFHNEFPEIYKQVKQMLNFDFPGY